MLINILYASTFQLDNGSEYIAITESRIKILNRFLFCQTPAMFSAERIPKIKIALSRVWSLTIYNNDKKNI